MKRACSARTFGRVVSPFQRCASSTEFHARMAMSDLLMPSIALVNNACIGKQFCEFTSRQKLHATDLRQRRLIAILLAAPSERRPHQQLATHVFRAATEMRGNGNGVRSETNSPASAGNNAALGDAHFWPLLALTGALASPTCSITEFE